MSRHETWVERQIREATERGEFDNLRGAGAPLDLGDPDDPDWWVRRKLAEEDIDLSSTLPPVMQLRREAATFPESLLDLAGEDSVREVLADYNRRVVQDRLRPVVGRAMPVVAPRVDVEEMVARWRDLRARIVAPQEQPDVVSLEEQVEELPATAARRAWWLRVFRRAAAR